MAKKIPFSFILIIGLMLFALFFGAGNLIFPPMLGQMAGENVWTINEKGIFFAIMSPPIRVKLLVRF